MMHNKWEDTPFKSPMARARGHGSSHSGVHHWIRQKITAAANIPLTLWAVWAALTLAAAGADHAYVVGFFMNPINAIMMVLFLLSVFYHAALGLQVVIEDYVHHETVKMFSLVGMQLAIFMLTVASVFSVLKLAI